MKAPTTPSITAQATAYLAALPPTPRLFMRAPVLSDGAQLFASKFRLILPSEDELRQEIERERAAIEMAQTLNRNNT